MEYECFQHILEKISSFMQHNVVRSEDGGGHISLSLQLGMTLRFLARGSHLDLLSFFYGVSKSTFYSHVYDCILLISEHFPIVFPVDTQVWRR